MDLKKGNKRDVWVVFHKESSQTTSIHSFKETLQQESIKFTLETLGHSAQIQFYILNGEPKKQNDFQELLARYEFNIDERLLNNTTTLHLNLFLIDVPTFQTFESLEQLTEFVTTSKKEGVKNLILFENVSEWLSAQMNENVPRLDEFKKWLLRLQIDSGIDFIQTCSCRESVETLIKCVEQTIRVKHKKEVVLFKEGRKINLDKAQLKGISNKYQIMWCEMLMSFQGVSEDKAIQICLEYPSFRRLMNDFKEPQLLSKLVGQNVSERMFQFLHKKKD